MRCFFLGLLTLASLGVPATFAQLPFYTDDPAVTSRGKFHFEFFNEYDALHGAAYPDVKQNTANFKVNFGLPHHLELDFDAPHLSIYRAPVAQSASGMGDADFGIKWKFHETRANSHAPVLAASLYIEFPTGNKKQQLSSGLTDYWLNYILQEPLSATTRININTGFLFAGNTSTGAIGIETTRGHVFTGGASVLHDFTPRWTLGAEVYGGVADNDSLGRRQLQGMLGGQYNFRRGLALTFGFVAGKYEASPRLGGQLGLAVDLPGLYRSSDH
jgi:Putative MetA-pathway of phenol degradation